jgi:hypothetical protein
LPGWLSGWGNRKSHVINPASGAGTGYQVRIRAHYGSGTDSGEHVYLNGKCRTDFGDIRFTRSDGVTLLDYWMGSKVDSDYAIFWVEVTDDLSTNSVTIYIYYGNATATTTSNGDDTFIFFDDFPGTSLDTAKWTTFGAPTITVSNSEIDIQKTAASAGIQTVNSFPQGRAVGFKFKGIQGTDHIAENRIKYDDYNRMDSFYTRYGGVNNYNANTRIGGTWGAETTLYNAMVLNTYYIAEITYINNSLQVKLYDTSYTQLGSTHSSSPSWQPYYVICSVYSSAYLQEGKWDWVYVRKYVSPEPSHGAWGSEETIIYLVSVQDSARALELPELEATLLILGKYYRELLGYVFDVPVYLVRDGDKILSIDHNLQVEAYNAIKRKLREWGIL